MANPSYSNAGHFYAPQVKPVLLNCSFKVDPNNTNGLGISGLTGPGIDNVFMHTNQTPLQGNPNPANGYAVIQLSGFHNKFLSMFVSVNSPILAPSITLSSGVGITAGKPYIINTLGTTTTAANWVTAGLPLGYKAQVGSPFIATAAAAAGTGLGNASVFAAGISNIVTAEVIGDPQTEIQGKTPAGNIGSQLIVQFLSATSAAVTTLIPTAPAVSSIIKLSFYLSDSNVQVEGQ